MAQVEDLASGADEVGRPPAKARRSQRRRLVLAALCLIGIALAASNWWALKAARSVEAREDDARAALAIAHEVRHLSERLLLSAHLAVATGRPQWLDRYERTRPSLEAALAVARAPGVPAAHPHIEGARTLSGTLRTIEATALMHLDNGRVDDAVATLGTEGARRHSDDLLAAVQRWVALKEDHLDLLAARAARHVLVADVTVASLGLVLLGLVGYGAFTRRERATQAGDGQEALVMRDPLTGLANRMELEEELERGALLRALAPADAAAPPEGEAHPSDSSLGGRAPSRASAPNLAYVAVDLDGFRIVNEVSGSRCGDLVLKAAAYRLKTAFPDEFIARIGADEFVVLCRMGEDGVEGVAGRCALAIEKIKAPMRCNGMDVSVSASVGVDVLEASCPSEESRRGAAIALKLAKAAGGGQVRVFTDEMRVAHRADAAAKEEVRRAFAKGEFIAHFQPIVDLASGHPLAAEALVRWALPDGSTRSPAVFLRHLEALGLLEALTFVMMDRAFSAASRWPLPIEVSVNVPPTQLRDDFAARTLALVDQHGLARERVVIEVLETALVRSEDRSSCANTVLDDLRKQGLRVALDDFGVGYSSLGQLSRLPVDKLKIDRSFTQALGPPAGRTEAITDAKTGLAVAHAAVNIGAAFGLTVVAEGVERPEHVDRLLQIGCRIGQGYRFGAPMSPCAFSDYLTGHAGETAEAATAAQEGNIFSLPDRRPQPWHDEDPDEVSARAARRP